MLLLLLDLEVQVGGLKFLRPRYLVLLVVHMIRCSNSILGPGQLNVGRLVPQGRFDVYRGEELTMPDWCYHVSIDMELSLPIASTSLLGDSEALSRQRWVEDILVSCRQRDYGLERQDSRD